MKKTIMNLMVAVFAVTATPAFADNHNHKTHEAHVECKCDCPHKKEGKCDHNGECKNCEHCAKHENCKHCNSETKCKHGESCDMNGKCEKCETCKDNCTNCKNCKGCEDCSSCEECDCCDDCETCCADKDNKGFFSKLKFW